MADFNFWKYLLGIDQQDLSATQMVVRASLVYVATIAMMRIGERRVLGKNTAFDVILGVVLGSMLSRAINGGADLTPTLIAGLVLIGLHWIFAAVSFRFGWFGRLVKGRPLTLMSRGERNEKNLGRAHITQRDLEEASRRSVQLADPDEAEEVRLERSGEISFIMGNRDEDDRGLQPKVLDVKVREGVQTVRIELVRQSQ